MSNYIITAARGLLAALEKGRTPIAQVHLGETQDESELWLIFNPRQRDGNIDYVAELTIVNRRYDAYLRVAFAESHCPYNALSTVLSLQVLERENMRPVLTPLLDVISGISERLTSVMQRKEKEVSK